MKVIDIGDFVPEEENVIPPLTFKFKLPDMTGLNEIVEEAEERQRNARKWRLIGNICKTVTIVCIVLSLTARR